MQNLSIFKTIKSNILSTRVYYAFARGRKNSSNQDGNVVESELVMDCYFYSIRDENVQRNKC